MYIITTDKNMNKDKTLLNYIKAQPNKEQPIKTPYGEFNLAKDNWYPKISTKKQVFYCLLAPVLMCLSWLLLVFFSLNDN